VRLIGPVLLVVLFFHLDIKRITETINRADTLLIIISILVSIPLILLKTVRWLGLLQAQGLTYGFMPAFLAYFGSIAIGLLTPGRFGEFVKVMHVTHDCKVSPAQAFSSVLGDRLFDFYILLLVGTIAFFTIDVKVLDMMKLVSAAIVLCVPLIVFLNDFLFAVLRKTGYSLGRAGRKLFAEDGWIVEMRTGLRCLTLKGSVSAVVLTIIGYAVFFEQCNLIAIALKANIGFASVSFAVAIGSLVTLIPISISGIGTREAAIILYLGKAGVPNETAMAFSLLVFIVSYIGSGFIGAIAWWLKPLPAPAWRLRP
jgi:hypothetical protein